MTFRDFNVKNEYVSGFGTFTLNYANGKLVKIKIEGIVGTGEINITYSGKQVIYSENGLNYDSGEGVLVNLEGVFQLNSEGFLESGSYKSTTDEYQEGQLTCEYSNSYLTKITVQKHNDTNGIIVETRDIYYDANNNLSMTRTNSNGTTKSITFTASNYPSKGKTLPVALLGNIMEYSLFLKLALYWSGLFGKEPKNLTDFFNYTFDKDGYVNTMILTDGYEEETYTFSYD